MPFLGIKCLYIQFDTQLKTSKNKKCTKIYKLKTKPKWTKIFIINREFLFKKFGKVTQKIGKIYVAESAGPGLVV